MASYTVRQNGEKWEVVDKDGKVVATRASEEAADDKADSLAIRDLLDERLPGKELSAEEKAALYDEMMAKKGKDDPGSTGGAGGTGGAPPAPDPKPEKTPEPSSQRKSRGGYWPTDE